MNNNNFKIYGINELSTISKERIIEINKFATYEYQKYINTKTIKKSYYYESVNTNSRNKKTPDKKGNPYIPYRPFLLLEKTIVYKANSKTYILNNNIEKTLFICNGIFPDDEKFLNNLTKLDLLDTLNDLIQTNIKLENLYPDNERLSNFQKNIFYSNFIKKHTAEIKKLMDYFINFEKITNINIIINKLFQINYFNNELYNSYLEKNENDKVKKYN